jgi:DNA-binding SARP family transcriptional activator
MGRLAAGPRSRPRGGDVARGLAALLGILALVAGVPAALWLAVGWPLPHALPTLAELREGLSSTAIPEDLFPKVLAVVAWLAWAQFTACVVVEARSALRGRLASRVPGAGWGAQRLASTLVAGVMTLLPTQGLSAIALASQLRPPAVVRAIAPPEGAVRLDLAADQATAATATGPQAVISERKAPDKPPLHYEVKRRDTLWAIAERHLGDPLRWPEIFELSKGRPQPDGRELKAAHWIYPGWTLLLPPDAVGLPERAGGTGQSGSASPPEQKEPEQKEPGKSEKPSRPPHHDNTAPSRTTTTSPTTTTQPAKTTAPPASGLPVPGGGTATPPGGGGGSTPSTTAPPSTTERPTSTTGTTDSTRTTKSTSETTESSGTTGTPATTEPSETTASRPPGDNVGTILPRGALLAAGVLALLGILRMVQQRRRASRRRIAMPEEEPAAVEAKLRASEAPDAAELIDLSLRAMSAAVRRDGMEPPDVVGVLVGPDMLEILLARETPAAPEPFVLSYSRRRWGLPVDVPIERLRAAAGGTASPVPALVTLGNTQNGLLLLNLEAPGLTALGGDPDAARAMLASFAVELATCRWADFIELILVGFGHELRRLERARVADSVREVLPWLEHKADDVADLLGETEAHSVMAGRVTDDTPDGWVPAVVLCAERPTPEEVTRLVALTAVPSRSPVAAVIAAADIAGARFNVPLPEEPGEPVHLPQFRLDVVPMRLEPSDYEGVAGLFETTTRDDVPAREPAWQAAAEVVPHDTDRPEPAEAGVPADTEDAEDDQKPEGAGAPRTPRLHELRLTGRGPLAGVEVDEAPDIEVRVLGRIEIAGIDRVERGKSEELVVFLALHPDGVDGDQLAEALWPGRPPARGTLNTTTAVARAYLGMTPDGEPRLPHARNGIYRLDPSVAVDWVRFQALAERGYAAGPDGADDLRRALELVRGRAFEGAKPRSYGWAQLDEAPVMEAAIVDVADYLAALLLDAGDHAGAQWAARRGISTAPYDERLYRKLMLAADAAGNPAGVEAVMDELLLRIDEENLEPYDTLHDETRALYERLTHHHRASRPRTNAG